MFNQIEEKRNQASSGHNLRKKKQLKAVTGNTG